MIERLRPRERGVDAEIPIEPLEDGSLCGVEIRVITRTVHIYTSRKSELLVIRPPTQQRPRSRRGGVDVEERIIEVRAFISYISQPNRKVFAKLLVEAYVPRIN